MKVTGQSWMPSILLGALQTEKKVFCLKRVYDKTDCPAYGLYMAHMDNSSLGEAVRGNFSGSGSLFLAT